jgi:hypothetical protein
LSPRRPRSAQRSAQEDFDISRCIAAYEHFPTKRQHIENFSLQYLGRSLKQLLKMRDNLDQERIKSSAFRSALKYHRAALAAGDLTLFDDILGSSETR